jgi:ligand-binding SRPBCC domain-containing protein
MSISRCSLRKVVARSNAGRRSCALNDPGAQGSRVQNVGTPSTRSRKPVQIGRQRDGTFRLTIAVLLADTIEHVFGFVADVDNLETVVPPWLGLRLLTPRPIDMGVGTRIDYRLRIHRMPVHWESEVTTWEPPGRFVYEQRRGPFSHWAHEHTIADHGAQTVARDDVRYAVPGGRLAHKLFVRRDLERLFLYRRAQLIRILGKRQ